MKLKLFDYDLPKELIAQTPAVPRDCSRLLVYNGKTKKIVHDHFLNLPKYLTNNDVLVFNDTKVFPARLIGNKQSGGRAEILLLKHIKNGEWESMVGCTRPKSGLKLRFKAGLQAELVNRLSEKTWLIKFNFKGDKFNAILNQIGQTPLPPYIQVSLRPRSSGGSKLEKQRYQTVYARHLGSAAAPTAGLHFTKNLLNKVKKRGCEMEFVTLHVGLGTFNPVNTENIEDYKIHSEWASVDKATMKRLIEAKQQGKRIIAVGTTSTRVLESFFEDAPMLHSMGVRKKSISKFVDIFIYPSYKFKFVDALITNFHLPKSSLLMLVSAFIGRTTAMKIYQTAIKMKYRFFSFGDAMLLTKK